MAIPGERPPERDHPDLFECSVCAFRTRQTDTRSCPLCAGRLCKISVPRDL